MSSPRPGGEADKFGNRFEEAWTVSYLLEVVAENADWISAEPADTSLGNGAEFAVEASGVIHVHQVKRQRSDAASWTIKALADEGILGAAVDHVRSGREFHFVSMTPAKQISTLIDKARRSDSFAVFKWQMLSQEQAAWLDNLVSTLGSDEEAWTLLHGMTVAIADELQIGRTNAIASQALFEGLSDARQAPSVLGEFIAHNLGRTIDSTFAVERLSRDYGLRRRDVPGVRSLTQKVEAATALWKRMIDREQAISSIPRSESEELVKALTSADGPKVSLLTGDAGSGKSCVLRQVVQELQNRGQAVLVLRLDRVDTNPLRSTTDLGRALEIEGSPVSALRAIANGGSAALVIDQLDAVSLISGRAPQMFDIVAELVEQAKAYPEIRIIIACRSFDLKNDHRIRNLADREKAAAFNVGNLTDSQLDEVLESARPRNQVLTAPQRELLKVPLNLRLFLDLDNQSVSFSTRKSLFDAYWDLKRRTCQVDGVDTDRFVQVLTSLAQRMSREQRLSLPESGVSDALRGDADKLASAHLIVLENRRWAFFHEAFFDYVFARYWVRLDQTLHDFLIRGEQELFRRSQVRQVLWSLVDDDEDRFLTEVEELLTSSSIRYHLKEVTLAVLGTLTSPSADAWNLVNRLIRSDQVPFNTMIRSIRSIYWLRRLVEEKTLPLWLEGDKQEFKSAALELIDVGARQDPELAARLMRPYVDHPEFPAWMRWLVRVSDLEVSQEWFSLVRDGVVSGAIDVSDRMFWHAADGLPSSAPDWAIELLQAVFLDRVHALELGGDGKVSILGSRDDGLIRFIERSAQARPDDFAWFCLRYIAAVADATAYPPEPGRPRAARQFAYILYNNSVPDVGDVLLSECCKSVRSAAAADPEQRDALIGVLAASEYEALQFVLYMLMQDHADTAADRIAQILLQGERRYFAGYADSPFWETRNLLAASSKNFRDGDFAAIESGILSFRPEGESHPDGVGYSSFTLASALPWRRLSDSAKDFLRECRVRYGEERPLPPRGIIFGAVESPVSKTEGASFTDSEWLEAITAAEDGHDDRRAFVGGPHELSLVLADLLKAAPARFISLLEGLPSGSNASYFGAALRALGDEGVEASPSDVYRFVLNCVSRSDSEIDRWLGHALRPYLSDEIPLHVVEALASRAIQSSDPGVGPPAVTIREDGDHSTHMDNLHFAGMNSARGALAETMADLLITDYAGYRASVLIDSMATLASDENPGVRSCVARLVSAALNVDVSSAVEAFIALTGSDEDRLLASRPVQDLIVYVGYRDVATSLPIVERMLRSDVERVRRAGGALAAFFGLEVSDPELVLNARRNQDPSVRAGLASGCARRLLITSNPVLAAETIEVLMDDPDESVRKAVAGVAAVLRGHALDPHRGLLAKLIESASFDQAAAQIFLTLDQALEKIDELVMLAARRYLELHGNHVGDISTHAAADAHKIAELVVRAYSQSRDDDLRRAALDLVDEMLMHGVLNIRDLLQDSER